MSTVILGGEMSETHSDEKVPAEKEVNPLDVYCAF